MPQNFEFKAVSANNKALEEKLESINGRFAGEDFQRDTYFNVPHGRLKLREGNMENALIYYEREDHAGPKHSRVLLYQHHHDKNLKEILTAALTIKVIVEKRRRIWFVDNVKLHFDTVEKLGTFVEVEAIDNNGTVGIETLKNQCSRFAALFGIQKEHFLAESYSDLLLNKQGYPD